MTVYTVLANLNNTMQTKQQTMKQEADGPHRSPEKTFQINKHI